MQGVTESLDSSQKAGGPAQVQQVQIKNSNASYWCVCFTLQHQACSGLAMPFGLGHLRRCICFTCLFLSILMAVARWHAAQAVCAFVCCRQNMNNLWGATWEVPQQPQPPIDIRIIATNGQQVLRH